MSVVKIDVVSDVICPWCFLGKRRLDKAITMVPEIAVQVTYRPFFLDPSIPFEGLDRTAYMTAKFGKDKLATIHEPLIAASKAEGVPYAFDKIKRTPNTLDAHRLLRWAQSDGKQHAAKEALFMAYWHEGRDVGSRTVLVDIAGAVGMDRNQVNAELATDNDKENVANEVLAVARMGVTGVPTFILVQKYGVVGAQSPEVLADAIRKAAAG